LVTLSKVQDYVKKYRAQGYSDNKIKGALAKSGVEASMVRTALQKKGAHSNLGKYLGIGALVLLAIIILVVALSFGPKAECSTDRDCSSGFMCSEGSCVAETLDECSSNFDCAAGYSCSFGSCVIDNVILQDTSGCDYNSDCAIGQVCTSGSCVADNTDKGVPGVCGDGVCFIGEEGCVADCGCTNDDQCESDEVCDEETNTCEDKSSGGSGGGSDGGDGGADSHGAVEICDNNIDDNANGLIDVYGGCDVDSDAIVDYFCGCDLDGDALLADDEVGPYGAACPVGSYICSDNGGASYVSGEPETIVDPDTGVTTSTSGICYTDEDGTYYGADPDCAVDVGSCGDGVCQAPQEDEFSCGVDCEPTPATCGNGICDILIEDEFSCAADCVVDGVICGDGTCDVLIEDEFSCAADCLVGIEDVEECSNLIDDDGDGLVDTTGGCDIDVDEEVEYLCGCYDGIGTFSSYGDEGIVCAGLDEYYCVSLDGSLELEDLTCEKGFYFVEEGDTIEYDGHTFQIKNIFIDYMDVKIDGTPAVSVLEGGEYAIVGFPTLAVKEIKVNFPDPSTAYITLDDQGDVVGTYYAPDSADCPIDGIGDVEDVCDDGVCSVDEEGICLADCDVPGEICGDFIDNDGDGFIDALGGCEWDALPGFVATFCGCYDEVTTLFSEFGSDLTCVGPEVYGCISVEGDFVPDLVCEDGFYQGIVGSEFAVGAHTMRVDSLDIVGKTGAVLFDGTDLLGFAEGEEIIYDGEVVKILAIAYDAGLAADLVAFTINGEGENKGTYHLPDSVECPYECIIDAECDVGFTCEYGLCEETVVDVEECTFDFDCTIPLGDGYLCVDAECVEDPLHGPVEAEYVCGDCEKQVTSSASAKVSVAASRDLVVWQTVSRLGSKVVFQNLRTRNEFVIAEGVQVVESPVTNGEYIAWVTEIPFPDLGEISVRVPGYYLKMHNVLTENEVTLFYSPLPITNLEMDENRVVYVESGLNLLEPSPDYSIVHVFDLVSLTEERTIDYSLDAFSVDNVHISGDYLAFEFEGTTNHYYDIVLDNLVELIDSDEIKGMMTIEETEYLMYSDLSGVIQMFNLETETVKGDSPYDGFDSETDFKFSEGYVGWITPSSTIAFGDWSLEETGAIDPEGLIAFDIDEKGRIFWIDESLTVRMSYIDCRVYDESVECEAPLAAPSLDERTFFDKVVDFLFGTGQGILRYGAPARMQPIDYFLQN
jgi:hypothetical protein